MKSILILSFMIFLGACASLMEDDGFKDKVEGNDGVQEYNQKLQVKVLDTPVKTEKKSSDSPKSLLKSALKKKPARSKPKPLKPKVIKRPKMKLPEIEDKEGFIGRRPEVDPYTVGEKVVWDVSYLNMTAGTITLETKPFVEVNKNKSYHFSVAVKSSSMFGFIYKVSDTAETYLDYNEMRPHNLEVHVKESKQVKESRTYFDWDKLTGHYWMKRKKKGRKEQEKKRDWKIQNYSQNFISAIYYLRTFKWSVGKEIKFYIADEGRNLIFKGKALREEEISTDAGTFKTIVIKPEIQNIQGSLKPVGEIYLWLTNDDRKIPVKIKTEIKIGSIVAEATSIK